MLAICRAGVSWTQSKIRKVERRSKCSLHFAELSKGRMRRRRRRRAAASPREGPHAAFLRKLRPEHEVCCRKIDLIRGRQPAAAPSAEGCFSPPLGAGLSARLRARRVAGSFRRKAATRRTESSAETAKKPSILFQLDERIDAIPGLRLADLVRNQIRENELARLVHDIQLLLVVGDRLPAYVLFQVPFVERIF